MRRSRFTRPQQDFIMTDIRIIPMSMDDYPEAMDMWRGTEGIGLYLLRNPGLSHCARSGNELVGTVLAGHDGRRGYLQHLCVREDFRKLGIGRRLVDTALEALAAIGLDKAHAFIFSDNEQGKRFWTGIGWVWRTDLGIVSSMTGRDRK
jgi:putative acetyltransferase